MTRSPLLLVLLGLMALTSKAQLEFEHNGLTRTYYLDAPDPIPAGAPLVVVLLESFASRPLVALRLVRSPLKRGRGLL